MAADGAGSSRISVILPFYNAASYLAEAIGSVLEQTVPPFEIVAVDDGSDDDGARIASSFGDAVRLVGQRNGGANAARNTGVAQSRGELVAFLDADDLWPAESLALRLRLLADHPEAGFVHGAVAHFFSAELTADRRDALELPPVRPARLASAMLFRRSALAMVGPFDRSLKMGEMIDWSARAQRIGITGVETGELVLRRRIHETNSVHAKDVFSANNLRALRAALAQRRSTAAPAG